MLVKMGSIYLLGRQVWANPVFSRKRGIAIVLNIVDDFMNEPKIENKNRPCKGYGEKLFYN